MRKVLFATIAVLSFASVGYAKDKNSPVPLAPQHAGVGRMAPELKAKDIQGRPFDLFKLFPANKVVVLAVTSTSCPVSLKYWPTLASLESEFGPKGIAFVFLNPLATDTPESMKKAAAKVKGPYLHDSTGELAKALGAVSTGDVFVIDAGRTVVYHGAVDDQYGVGYSTETPTKKYLAKALEALLAGNSIDQPATTAPGCELDLKSVKEPATPAVTYHNRISRILQLHCIECHREGGVGPFPLTSLAEVLGHKGMIRKVVGKGTMPPWFAVDPAGSHGKWMNDSSLSAADKEALLAWFDAGAPEGNVADAPLPRSFPKDWAIGKPDLVLKLPKAIAIKAAGTMPYQLATVETNVDEDKWVQGLEIHPTNRSVVHHVLVFIAGTEATANNPLARIREQAEERSGFFAAYVPGNDHQIFPEGFAKKLPKGARLRFQIHYTPNGTATEDRMELGIVFAKKPPTYELKVAGIANPKISIPPGVGDHPETAILRSPFDAVVTAFMPHMHLRGKACKYEITTSDGKTVTLLDIPRYDFNWQIKYQLAEPLSVPRGTTLKFLATYDNSDKNPANPDPGKTVKWGQQTTDEMMLGYIEYYFPANRNPK